MILDCRVYQEQCKDIIRDQVEQLKAAPKFTIIQVGNNAASNRYIGQKVKHCQDVGIVTTLIQFNEDITTDKLIEAIQGVQVLANALIVQLPLPQHINERLVLDSIDPAKDVDCLTTTNIGKLHAGLPYVYPCTPLGIIKLFEIINYDLTGANVLIVGRSHIVGRPMAEMMTAKNATVTLAHSKTEQLKHMLRGGQFDVIIAAAGVPKGFVGYADILIDVGINFIDGKMCGDFDLDGSIYQKATPVPNGVGRMTIIGLLENIVKVSQ